MIKESDFTSALSLSTVIPSENGELSIEESNANRPGLQLAGFWDFFAYERPQLLGKGEMTYLSMMDKATRRERLNRFFSYALPCVIITRGIPCLAEMRVLAAARHIPVYRTEKETTLFELDLINYLNHALAPRTDMHGVLVNVYGAGLLITGSSGVGKSEAALELVKRGHQLVADDVVQIRRVNDVLIGEAPELVRHFMEIRGIGIINIASMFGIGAVINSMQIDMEIHLELWQPGKEYDRLGMTDEFTEILGVRLPHILLPIQPGRNLAVVLEVAARNLKQKQIGYNAANDLVRRQMERMGIQE